MPPQRAVNRLARKTLHLLRQLEALRCDAENEGIGPDLHVALVLTKHHLRCWYDLISQIRQPSSRTPAIADHTRRPEAEDKLQSLVDRLDSIATNWPTAQNRDIPPN